MRILLLLLVAINASAQRSPAFLNQSLKYRVAADASSTLNNGIVAYWKLDEFSDGTGAVTREDSAGSLDLTDNNTTASGTGILDDAADLETSSAEFLESAADPAVVDFNGNQDFTLAIWIQPETLGNDFNIISKWNSGGNQRQYALQIDVPANVAEFFVSANGTSGVSIEATTFGALSIDTWYLVIAWHDATADTINISVNNGTANSAAHSTGIFNGSAAFRLGNLEDGTFEWDGKLDEAGIWNRVLTADERTELYNSGAAKTCCPF